MRGEAPVGVIDGYCGGLDGDKCRSFGLRRHGFSHGSVYLLDIFVARYRKKRGEEQNNYKTKFFHHALTNLAAANAAV